MYLNIHLIKRYKQQWLGINAISVRIKIRIHIYIYTWSWTWTPSPRTNHIVNFIWALSVLLRKHLTNKRTSAQTSKHIQIKVCKNSYCRLNNFANLDFNSTRAWFNWSTAKRFNQPINIKPTSILADWPNLGRDTVGICVANMIWCVHQVLMSTARHRYSFGNVEKWHSPLEIQPPVGDWSDWSELDKRTLDSRLPTMNWPVVDWRWRVSLVAKSL